MRITSNDILQYLVYISNRITYFNLSVEYTRRMSLKPSRNELSQFLRTQTVCVIATVDSAGGPNAATVAFSESTDGQFIIGTSAKSRKATNIDANQRVALTVTDAEKRYTVQLEGVARKLSPDEFARYAEEHYSQLPSSRPYKDAPGQVDIIIQPTHIRFSDCSSFPWVTTDYDK